MNTLQIDLRFNRDLHESIIAYFQIITLVANTLMIYTIPGINVDSKNFNHIHPSQKVVLLKYFRMFSSLGILCVITIVIIVIYYIWHDSYTTA